jgi:hypothetical protein
MKLISGSRDYVHVKLRSSKVLDVFDGEYRIFFNFYNDGNQITLGYPKDNCSDKEVYLAIDGDEQDRITISEASGFMSAGMRNLLGGIASINSLPSFSTSRKSIPQYSHSSGHCIRCGESIDFDTDKPFCYSCFKSWSRWSNEDYAESFCHSCGKERDTSKAKPQCYKCYKK